MFQRPLATTCLTNAKSVGAARRPKDLLIYCSTPRVWRPLQRCDDLPQSQLEIQSAGPSFVKATENSSSLPAATPPLSLNQAASIYGDLFYPTQASRRWWRGGGRNSSGGRAAAKENEMSFAHKELTVQLFGGSLSSHTALPT